MSWGPFTSARSFLLLFLFLGLGSRICYGSGFGFDIHHRFSDPVKGILSLDGLPERGSVEYYAAMSHRDRLIRGRHLAASDGQTSPLTFVNGNETAMIGSLGFLHYANVSVGTPSLSFLVALDTGSDLFWLPCDCMANSCVTALQTSSSIIDLSIYSPSNSSTSKNVSCDSTLCGQTQCPSANSNCPYNVLYLSSNTSSTGIYVEDILHLVTDDDQQKAVDTLITFGCGQIQTGIFLEGAAPNGLFGLGIENISVPSTLARNGLASNSFALCFGRDGVGRISFGNNGSSDQGETPFNIRQLHPTYNISITQITVGQNSSELEFSAIFDSGTSFTSLRDPAYTFISESFNSQIKEKRHTSDPQLPFDYCYYLSENQTSYVIPDVNLTMKGGDTYFLNNPTVVVGTEDGTVLYCLGLHKSDVNIDIIGQNFMTGYQIVFDRERMVLGWKDSNCYNNQTSNNLPISPSQPPTVSPALPVDPEATGNNSQTPVAAPPTNHSPNLKSFTCTLAMLLVSFFARV
ncbi:hypothetical protein F2P56_018907 [Juglans regia]|uniref:Aspartyl protease family protein 1-like n=2 Tax=Juglans regia TaxID=51240 RepID=A0A6P9EPH6_JUGRE|nr:aspartyl protease family protein 1-like [Juglans regia]KAF5462945.1 hypothetical protein F2P56_018907 [Juglans regia]